MTEAARSAQPRNLWDDLAVEALKPGPTMTITKAQYTALLERIDEADRFHDPRFVAGIEAESQQRGSLRSDNGLDVERLAEALRRVQWGHQVFGSDYWNQRARATAAEYTRLAPQPSAERATAQRTVPSADPATDGKHGALTKHYPRTGDALRGFLGQGVTETVCDGCGIPMFLRDGRWSAASPPAESVRSTEAEALRLLAEVVGNKPWWNGQAHLWDRIRSFHL